MDAVAWLLLAAFSVLSIRSIRHVGWLGPACAIVMSRAGAGLLLTPRARSLAAVGLTALLLIGSAWVATHGNVRGLTPGLGRASPLGDELLAALRAADVRGRVFNSYNLGDELVYHFRPQVEVVIDSRGDAYGEDYHRHYQTLSGRSYQRLAEPAALLAYLDQHAVDTIVNRPFNVQNWSRGGHLAALAQAGWDEIYRGDDAFVFRRRSRPD